MFTVFLKNRNFLSKIKRSKVTDNAALTVLVLLFVDDDFADICSASDDDYFAVIYSACDVMTMMTMH